MSEEGSGDVLMLPVETELDISLWGHVEFVRGEW